jgi:hypothetical protein
MGRIRIIIPDSKSKREMESMGEVGEDERMLLKWI